MNEQMSEWDSLLSYVNKRGVHLDALSDISPVGKAIIERLLKEWLEKRDRERVNDDLSLLDESADGWSREVDAPSLAAAVSHHPDKVLAMMKQSFVEGAYRGASSANREHAQRDRERDAVIVNQVLSIIWDVSHSADHSWERLEDAIRSLRPDASRLLEVRDIRCQKRTIDALRTILKNDPDLQGLLAGMSAGFQRQIEESDNAAQKDAGEVAASQHETEEQSG